MRHIMDKDILLRNVGLVFAEILVLILCVVMIQLVINIFLRKLSKAPFFCRFRQLLDKSRGAIKSGLYRLCLILCLFVFVFNGYLISQGIDLFAHYIDFLKAVPADAWRSFLLEIGEILLLLTLTPSVLEKLRKWLNALMRKTKSLGKIKDNDQSVERFFNDLIDISANTVWLFIFVAITAIIPFPDLIPQYLSIIAKVYLIISLGFLCTRAIAVAVETLDILSEQYPKSGALLYFYERLKGLIPVLRRYLEYVVYVCAATLVMLQVGFIAKFAEYGPRIISIIGIVFISRVFVEVGNLLVDKSMLRTVDVSDYERQQRMTIVPLIKSFLKYIIYFGAGIFILKAWGINTTPILAGAGILGVVVGLGAQPLINDIVSGFFILFENVYLVGDFIQTSSAGGIVEAIEIRTTQIRGPDGQLYILRNGQINEVINFSKGFTNAVVEVGVDYGSDLDRVYKVIEKTGEELKKTNKDVLEPTRVEGLLDFGESELRLRTVTKVKPGRHLAVGLSLRRMIKEAFDAENIEIPFARRVIIFKDAAEKRVNTFKQRGENA